MYKKKMNAQGRLDRYKASLVAKVYRQKSRIDYGEDEKSTRHEGWKRMKLKEGS